MAGIQVLIEENCRVDNLHRNLQRESLRLRAPRHAHTCTHPVPWHQNFPEVLGPTPPLSLDLSQSFPSQRPPPSLSHEATPSLPLSHQPPLPALVFFLPSQICFQPSHQRPIVAQSSRHFWTYLPRLLFWIPVSLFSLSLNALAL